MWQRASFSKGFALCTLLFFSLRKKGNVRFRLTASSFSPVRKGTKSQRATPFGERIFSTPFSGWNSPLLRQSEVVRPADAPLG